MLVVMPLVVLFFSYPLWGRVIDRFGRKPVLLIAGLFIAHGGATWILVTPTAWIWGYIGVIIAAAAWPGIELANFNLLLGMSESAGRQATAYVAINSLVGAIAGIASGLFGGYVAHRLGTWEGTLLGWTITYHGVLFLISGALRLLALLWLIHLHDPGASTTRTALRYMGTNFYSNLQQAVFMPGRLILRLSRWTYRLNPPTGQKPHDQK
jgi:MFS family permease